MKLRKLLTALSVGSVTALSLTSFSACSCNPANKYSVLVQAVANKMVEMNKTARCTSTGGHREYLDGIRVWISNEAYASGISRDKIKTDDYGNLWFDVPATSGYENYKPFIFQGHMDMIVAGLTDDKKPITPIDTVIEWDKGIVHAKDYKTSLGADDGMSMAVVFTLLQDKSYEHGPIRCLFTADEDSGMIGASWMNKNDIGVVTKMGDNFDGELIEYLINIDGGGLGAIERSCFGSITYTFGKTDLPEHTSEEKPLANKLYLDIRGLSGGHSSTIEDGGKANAEKCIYEILNSMSGCQIQIVNHHHPIDEKNETAFARNEIASLARVEFNTNLDKSYFQDKIKAKISEWKQKYKAENWDDSVKITVESSNHSTEHFMSKNDSAEFIKGVGGTADPTTGEATSMFYGAINGKIGSETVKLKSANISPVTVKYNDNGKYTATAGTQIRTKRNSDLSEMKDWYKNFNLFDGLVGPTKTESEYPAWYNDASVANKMIDIASDAYKSVGIEPKVYDGSAGVECTFWANMNKKLNIISIGPNASGAHTEKEILYLDGMQEFLDAIKYMSKQFK